MENTGCAPPFPTIHAFIGKRLTEDSIVRCSICLVAAAGSGLEPTPVKNSDVAATVTNQIALLQGTRCFGDADTSTPSTSGIPNMPSFPIKPTSSAEESSTGMISEMKLLMGK